MTPLANPSTYKLIAFDFDGTLIGSSKHISPYTKQVLERLRAKNIQITIATGRILPTVKALANELQIDHPLILSNGSILQTRQGKLISQTCLPLDVIQDTIQVCHEHACDLVLYVRDQLYYEQMTDNMRPMFRLISKDMHEIGSWNTITDILPGVSKGVIIDSGNEQNLVEMESVLHKMLNGRAVPLRTDTILLEVQPVGVTKATGLRALTKSLGIDLKEVIAFGDYDNDAEMLKAAGLGIAVGNATPTCLANADMQVPSPDEDGPAHFLEEFLLAS